MAKPVFAPDIASELEKALQTPIQTSQEDIDVVRAYDDTITQLLPFGQTRLKDENWNDNNFRTQAAGCTPLGLAFRKVQHDVLKAGLNILIKPDLCDQIIKEVCQPFTWEAYLFPALRDLHFNTYSLFGDGASGNALTIRAYAEACIRSPALALQGALAYLYIQRMGSALANVGTKWHKSKCPHLKNVAQLLTNDLQEAFGFADLQNMVVFSPVIAASFQDNLQGKPRDLTACTPRLMRRVMNAFQSNNAFRRENFEFEDKKATDDEGNDNIRHSYWIDCSAREMMRAIIIGETRDGKPFGAGISGLSEWLYTQHRRQWFLYACKDAAMFMDRQINIMRAVYDDRQYAEKMARHRANSKFGSYRKICEADKLRLAAV